MNKIYSFLVALFLGVSTYAQQVVALWNYNSITGSPVTTVADIGSGTSSVVGSMVVAAAATGMDPLINNGCGAQNGTNPGAWAFTANPGALNESSGVQFSASTVGVQNIRFTWDQRWSNTATNTVRLQYTLDGLTWVNFAMTADNTTFCNGSIDAGRFQNNGIGDQYRRISVNLSEITGADNNPNFGVRLLAAHFQSTGQFSQTSNSSLVATGGTWRFDNVSIQGQADVSIASASNFAVYSENIGIVNVPITVANANTADISLTFGLSVYSNATENEDYVWTNTLTIPANTNGISNLPINISNDLVPEKAERIVVKLLSGANANISLTNNYQIIFIKDNDYVAPTPTNELNMTLLSSFSNGTTGSNSSEIVAFDPTVDRLYIANSIAGKLDIVNFSNPSAPVLISSLSLAAYGNINSVTAYNGVVALAIESIPAQLNGKVVFFDSNGNYINQVTVGAMPDMITFNKDYTKLLTANEGEPNADYSVDPEGSVSIINLGPGYAALTNANVTTIGFTAYNGQESSLRSQGIRVFSSSASVAQDFEPEFIAVSDDNTKAYVTLQENNALLTINLQTLAIESLTALGYSSYSSGSGNALDASDQSGSVLITGDLPIKGAFMPDAIAYKTINGQGYLFSANEGDSREFGSVIDANRISSTTFNNVLDPTAFPDQAILRNNKFLGRLSALKYSGDTDGDGDYDQLHVMGGRSFSIWNPTNGSLVFDSKDLIEQITANHPTLGSIFNASNTVGAPALKNRSDDKGPEPEGVALAQINGSTYAFISLERIGGVMTFNVDNPNQPIYVGYANNRSAVSSGPDLGAEGIIIIPASDSPNGQTLVILANEVSSTLSIYQVNSCAELSGGTPISANDTICAGSTSTLSVQAVNGVSYQWLSSGNPIASATASTYITGQAGQYRLKYTNSTLSCVDTSAVVSVYVNPLPVINAGTNVSVCYGSSVTLSATGAQTFIWSNAIQNGVTFIPSSTTNYVVEGIDNNGCSSFDTVLVQVNPLPMVYAGSNASVCQGNSVTLNASGAPSLNWTNNVQNGVSFVPQTTLNYIVQGVDNNGCLSYDTVQVQVNSIPVVQAGSDFTICSGTPVTLIASGAQTYLWSNNVQNGIAFSPALSYDYIVQGTDLNGCVDSDTITVNVSDYPSLNAGVDQVICQSSIPYTLTAISNQAGVNFSWNSGETTSQIQVNASTIAVVTATNPEGCSTIDSVAIQVNANPSVELGPDTTVCENWLPLNLIPSSSSNLISYDWSTGESTPTIAINQAGTYNLVARDSNNCEAQDDITVIVEPCLSLVELEQHFTIYPNPASSSFHIESSFDEPMKIMVYSLEGRLLHDENSETSYFTIECFQWPVGSYRIVIQQAGFELERMFIKN